MAGLPNSVNSGSHSFQKIAATFLAQPGLPFANVLSAERIERIFAKHGNLFGAGAIYSEVLGSELTDLPSQTAFHRSFKSYL